MTAPLILVTGGAGYIGRVLVQKLLDYGARVRVVDTFYFPPFNYAYPGEAEWIRGDITNPQTEWFDDVDGVCHLAGFSNDPTADADPVRNAEVNEHGTARIGVFARDHGVKRFTYASSASVYDLPQAKYTNQATEKRAVAPVGHYSISKYAGEKALVELVNGTFNPIIFRQATVFGDSPRMRFDLVVNTMMRSALTGGEIFIHGGGTNHRPLISVDNVAMAHVDVMLQHPTRPGGVYNLVDYNMSVRQVAEEVQAGVELATGKRPKLVSIPSPKGVRVRDYQVSGEKYGGEHLVTSLRYHVQSMATKWQGKDMFKPEYENIKWMELVG